MADPSAPGTAPERERLRFSNRSIVVAVLILVGAVALVGVVSAATRVIGWVVVAAFTASMLHPIVVRLNRRIPRGLAIAAVVIGFVGMLGLLVYSGIDEVRTQSTRLEQAAPDAALKIEHSKRFGEAAREFELHRRVEQLVEELPERLRGGDTATALRAAATRGVAFFITGMLTLFMIIHGRRLAIGALSQVHDPARRNRLEELLLSAYGRAWRYVVLNLARAIAAGLFAWQVCNIAEVPAGLLLGMWVAVWSLVPLIGVMAGSIAVLLLTLAIDPTRALGVFALFVAYQVAEVLLVQRRIERVSMHVGPVVTLIAGMAGFELYGIGGLLGGIAIAIVIVAVLRELARGEGEDLITEVDAILPGDEPADGSVPA